MDISMNHKLGGLGEDFASELLALKGYEILERNFRTKYGEIDIVARKDDTIFFVEVKTREGDSYGDGREAVNGLKRKHLKTTAEIYIRSAKEKARYYSFQVIEIRLSHIENLVF